MSNSIPAPVARTAWLFATNCALVVITALLLLFNDQSRDAARALVEANSAGPVRLGAFVTAAAFCGVATWYIMRRIEAAVRDQGSAGNVDRVKRLVAEHGPRVVGVLPLVVSGALLWMVAWKDRSAGFPATRLDVYAWASGLTLAAFGVWGIRYMVRRGGGLTACLTYVAYAAVLALVIPTVVNVPLLWILQKLSTTTVNENSRWWVGLIAGSHALMAWSTAVFLYAAAMVRRRDSPKLPLGAVRLQKAGRSLRAWGKQHLPQRLNAKGVFQIVLGFAVMVFVVTAFWPHAAVGVGPLGVMWLGCLLWGAVAGSLIGISLRWRQPVFLGVVVAALTLALVPVGTNHLVRTVSPPNPDWETQTVASRYEAWSDLSHREPIEDNAPVILIAAEGGGIYAAYHTAMVMAYLHDQWPGFSEHVFAASGVSGGSVGLTLFQALLFEHHNSQQPTQKSLELSVAILIDNDWLSPLLAAGIGRDLLPWPWWSALDRARALEDAIGRSWNQVAKGDKIALTEGRFEEGFTVLDPREWADSPRAPHLFLNTTDVASGRPCFLGPLSFTPSPEDQPNPNRIFHNLYDELGRRDVPIKTAAVLSARFPVVTPAGEIDFCGATPPYRQLVDGGYFENSGCATLEQVYTELRASSNPPRIVVIRISAKSDRKHPAKQGNALAPLSALLNTRGSHGEEAVERFRQAVKASGVTKKNGTNEEGEDQTFDDLWVDIELDLSPDNGRDIPLGWLLSDGSREQIVNQVKEQLTKEKIQEIKTGTP